MLLLRCVSWLLALAVLSGPRAGAQTFGPIAPEGEPARQQQWLVPSTEPGLPAHALLYRPAGDGPFPLALIAHSSTQNALRRAQMPQPSYTALARELVARGYAVLVPERLGHGRTGGPYVEDQGGCGDANYEVAGRATAAQILRALTFMREQPFTTKKAALVIGHSAGGWGALALADQSQLVTRIIVFAPGRGGHADDAPRRVCAEPRLREVAHVFGRSARVPVTWLVAANDSYFPPALSRQLADAFTSAGGRVNFDVLPSYGDEGHWLIERDDGVMLASDALARAIAVPRAPRSTRLTLPN
ncbi:peptidase [Bradyrhizobium sp. SSBR45G]|uniref:alpha/beta hydrolase family protein n=1 Tax=unclassified Bradyrhizobium TaxID=2631580 RepID=UPI002342BAA4|nr:MULTISPECIES: alpha/beta fold hydrolase [unclassified Bradyrhizobium]GLH76976.1 peptidase [Bradyrhizobium sp. SSBR45G]GLH83734.1 peptidase [Bradyrhizobium sp. SSBR45R]